MNEYLTISDALDGLRENEITATELVEKAIETGKSLNDELGIYIARYDEHAREAAAAADAVYAAGDEPGLLQGIPLGIKDIITTVEGETTAQSLVLDRSWGPAIGDAVVVQRMRDAGGVITGKTTTMEYAIGVPDWTKPFPIPRNPWNTEHWTGGSSSGTGNGVAAGAFLGGLGTDTGGSIRIPAAYCGISGIKATFGRVPKSGCVPLGYSLDHIGPMARSARDCAIMLQVLAGYDPSDACAVDAPVPDYLSGLTGDLTGLRVGVDTLAQHVGDDGDPATVAALQAAVSVLSELGATVTELALPYYAELNVATRVTSRSEAFAYHVPDFRSRWGDYFQSTRTGVGSAVAFTGADFVQAQRVRRVGQKAVAALFADVDVIVTPTASIGALSLEELGDLGGGWFRSMHTSYWNAVGNPALSVPMGFTAAALPLGMQIVTRPFDEATGLKVGEAYQRATRWHLAVPPLAGRYDVAVRDQGDLTDTAA
jgi:aspartyl-tRNA(Asn)/glutamyl-tRNA(Gln) amidotransferase subunit A